MKQSSISQIVTTQIVCGGTRSPLLFIYSFYPYWGYFLLRTNLDMDEDLIRIKPDVVKVD